MAMDTQGNLWAAHIHSANTSDPVAGCDLLDKSLKIIPEIEAICADGGYGGTFFNHAKDHWDREVPIGEKIQDGFAVIRKRWVVGRPFGWLNG